MNEDTGHDPTVPTPPTTPPGPEPGRDNPQPAVRPTAALGPVADRASAVVVWIAIAVLVAIAIDRPVDFVSRHLRAPRTTAMHP